jgi:hypothetical protein
MRDLATGVAAKTAIRRRTGIWSLVRSPWSLVRSPPGTRDQGLWDCLAEVHWYEAHGVGRREYKIKRILGDG